MNKSQNTKNEQHCIKQNEKSFTQKDLSLTELGQKGELKLGEHYYYTTIFSPTVHIQNFTRDVVSFQDFKETVAEVLATVPSYEQWKAKLNENATLKTEYKKECHRADELEDSYWKAEKENAKLKKQVAIAVKALDSLRGICYPQVAEKAFEQIKELDK